MCRLEVKRGRSDVIKPVLSTFGPDQGCGVKGKNRAGVR